MAFECPRRSSPPSPMFDADTGCIATDPMRRRPGVGSAARRASKTFRPTNTPKKLRTRRLRHEPRVEFSQGARVVDPAFGMGCRVRHPNILTSRESKWIPYFAYSSVRRMALSSWRRLNGFNTMSAIPPSLSASARVAPANPVTMMTGISGQIACARLARSVPINSGIVWSVTMMSKLSGAALKASRASRLLVKALTL